MQPQRVLHHHLRASSATRRNSTWSWLRRSSVSQWSSAVASYRQAPNGALRIRSTNAVRTPLQGSSIDEEYICQPTHYPPGAKKEVRPHAQTPLANFVKFF